MEYMIVVDLDDTLLNDQKEITLENKKTIEHLKSLGHKIVIATGRAYHGAINFYKDLNLNGPMITDNGALISNPSDTNFKPIRETIPLNVFKSMFKDVKHMFASCSLNKDSVVYGYKYSEKLDSVFNGLVADTIIELDYQDLDFDPMGLAVAVYVDYLDEFNAYFDTHPTITSRFWGNDDSYGYYDVHLRHVSKASAVLKALELLKIDANNLITLGDGVNDIEMLALSKKSAAMKNARDIVKKHANNITPTDHNNSGVSTYLTQYFENKNRR